MFWEREDIQGQTLRCRGNFRHSVSTINMGDTWGTEKHCPSWSHHRAENTGASFSHLLHSPTICPTQPRPGMLWTLGNRSREDRLPLLKHCGLEHILNNSRSYLGLFHRERTSRQPPASVSGTPILLVCTGIAGETSFGRRLAGEA